MSRPKTEDEMLLESIDDNGTVDERKLAKSLRRNGDARPDESARRIIEERLGVTTSDGQYLED